MTLTRWICETAASDGPAPALSTRQTLPPYTVIQSFSFPCQTQSHDQVNTLTMSGESFGYLQLHAPVTPPFKILRNRFVINKFLSCKCPLGERIVVMNFKIFLIVSKVIEKLWRNTLECGGVESTCTGCPDRYHQDERHATVPTLLRFLTVFWVLDELENRDTNTDRDGL